VTRDWRIGLFSFAVCIAFIPFTSGGATVPRWAVMGLAPMLISGHSRFKAAHLFGVLLLTYCVGSLFWSANPIDGLGFLAQLGLYVAVFMLGGRFNLRPALIGLSIGLIPCGIATLVQHYWNQHLFLAYVTPDAGTFINCDIAAEVAALVFIGVLAERMWWAIPILLPMLIYPHSRTAWIAMVGAGLFAIWRRDKFIAYCLLIIGVCVVFMLYLTGFKTPSLIERFHLYEDTISGFTWFGHGIGSFSSTFPYYDTHLDTMFVHADYAHSDVLQIIFELGAGSVFFFIFAALCLTGTELTAKLVFIAFLFEMLGDFPLHVPMQPFIGAFVAGRLCQSSIGIHDLVERGRRMLSIWYVICRSGDRRERGPYGWAAVPL
jgi:hypothetical protein